MAQPAIIQCPTCQHDVSSTAFTCPSCGAVLKKPKRTVFGKICLYTFWAFNAFMMFWLYSGSSTAVNKQAGLSGAEAAGAAIGTGIGVILVATIWIFGAIILGLMAILTRPK